MAMNVRRPKPAICKRRPGPSSIRFDEDEIALIADLQRACKPTLTASEVCKRALRYAVPLFLDGTVPLYSITLPAKATNAPEAAAVSGKSRRTA